MGDELGNEELTAPGCERGAARARRWMEADEGARLFRSNAASAETAAVKAVHLALKSSYVLRRKQAVHN